MGLILDSSILIDAERRRLDVPHFLRWLVSQIGAQDIAISAISIAELAHGIARADTEERRRVRRTFLDDLKTTVRVFPLTSETAELAGAIGGAASEKGIVIPLDDLLIGASALEQSYAVGTHNLRHFEMIPGLQVIKI